jgi:hypothetical protein
LSALEVESRLDAALDRLWRWVERTGWESWDPYDVWGRRAGIAARRLWFRHRLVGAPLALAVVGAGHAGPLGRAGLRPRRSPVALALYACALMGRHSRTGDPDARERALELVDWLAAHATPAPSGPAWGHHFDWMTDVFLPAGTPTITVTPHVIDAAWMAHDLTGQPRFRELATGATRFVHHDLEQSWLDGSRAMTAYTPLGIEGVVNASSYRALVLYEALSRDAAEPAAEAQAAANLAAVLEAQGPDGGWPYRVGGARNFVDTFHTCFVVEHLARIARTTGRDDARRSAARGARYLIDLLLAAPLPPRYVAGRPSGLIAVDSYDCAEAIACLAVVDDLAPDALARAEQLASETIAALQRPDGAFLYRRYRGGLVSRLESHRWAQAPMAYALEVLRTKLGKLGDSGSHSYGRSKRPARQTSASTSAATRAGFPITTARAGTSFVTTDPAATSARSPISTPGMITAPAPMRAPLRTVAPPTQSW